MSDEWIVTMPKLGETVTEGTVGGWRKQVGDSVEFDDPLFEVSTDKVDSEIPSPYDGVILEILVPEGETVPVGTPLVRIGAPGSTPPGGNGGPPAVVAGGAGIPAEAVPGTAGSGGPSLNDPAAPQMGGSEAMPALEDPDVGVPAGEVHEITMPKLGETVTEGTVGRWRKQVGDSVEFDDPLFEVSTDKVDSEIPSPYDGVLLEILVPEGETVPVGAVLARIGQPGAGGAGSASPDGAPVRGAAPAAVGAPAAPAGGPTSGGAPTGGAATAGGADRGRSPDWRRGDGGRHTRRPGRTPALADRAAARRRGGPGRRGDHRHRRSRPDPARGRRAGNRQRWGTGGSADSGACSGSGRRAGSGPGSGPGRPGRP